jgi:uncharacterized protein (TIGR03435 family)
MCCLKFAAMFIALALYAQTTKPEFEAASIKPPTPLGPMGMRADRKGGPGTADPGMYTCENCPLFWVLSEAYDLQPFEFSGPDWPQNARFDFAAKVPAGTTKDAFRKMLQNLLEERFKLAAHREMKAMTVYEMTVSRGGPKFRESTSVDGPPAAAAGNLQRDADGYPILKAGTTMAVVPGHARIRSDGQTMAWFAHLLSGQLHSPVIDATGLVGKYDFLLSWSFEDNSAGDAVDALISAVQLELGLKLQQKKGQGEVLMIDRLEKTPSGN